MTHTTTPPDNKVHEGRNIKRFREMMQMKQDALAAELGDDWNQQKVSLLEQKETVDPAILAQVSTILNIPVEAFQNFDEEQAVNIIANTFTNSDNAIGFVINNNNPIDEIKKLHEEKMVLYERMLKEKDEMMATLKGLLEK